MRKSRFTTLATLTLFSLAFCVATFCSCVKVVAQDNNAAPTPAPVVVRPVPEVPDTAATADAGNGQEVLTRGPIHEAFAKPGVGDQQPILEVKRQPPEPIEELPPDQKPDGDNVVWISGYWSWDAERSDFLWVSGVWRDCPAGCSWVPGYWAQDEDVYRWVSGYWKKAHTAEAYVPAPPKTIEAGPTSDSPGDDNIWAPGNWIYRTDHYAWQPGYWLVAAPDRIYVPACYSWTPGGYVYVDGYWDFPLERRGIVFAPVYFRPVVYLRPAFVYTPVVIIETDILVANLFVAPRLGFYCFGDYYATSYADFGIYPWISVGFDFHIGYHDSIFDYYHHRGFHGDRNWEDHFRRDYRDRRDHPDFRPPRTFRAQEALLNERPSRANDPNAVIGRNFRDVVQKPTGTTRFVKVDDNQRKIVADQAREVRTERQKATPVMPRAEREKIAPTATAKPDTGAATTRPARPAAGDTSVKPSRGGADTNAAPDKGATTARPARPSATPDKANRPARGGADTTVKPDKGTTARPTPRPAGTPVTIKRPPRNTGDDTAPKIEKPATTARPERPSSTPETARRPPRGGEDTNPRIEQPTTTRPERPMATPETSARPPRGAEDTTPRIEQPTTTRPERPAATPEAARRPTRNDTPPAIEDRPAPRTQRPAAAPAEEAKRPARSADDSAAAAAKGAGRKPADDTTDTPTGRSGGDTTGRGGR